jgi:hypothetical protein
MLYFMTGTKCHVIVLYVHFIVDSHCLYLYNPYVGMKYYYNI